MEDITTNAAPEQEIEATCWHCTSELNKSNKVDKYLRDDKGKIVKEKVERKRKREMVKVLNPDYIPGVVRTVQVDHKQVNDGKCRIIGHCTICQSKVSSYVKKVDNLDKIGHVVQATCWSCTSAYNKLQKQAKYKKDPRGKLIREPRKVSSRSIYKNVVNPKFTRSVLRPIKIQRQFHEKNKIRIEGKCVQCGQSVSAFVKNKKPKALPVAVEQEQQ